MIQLVYISLFFIVFWFDFQSNDPKESRNPWIDGADLFQYIFCVSLACSWNQARLCLLAQLWSILHPRAPLPQPKSPHHLHQSGFGANSLSFPHQWTWTRPACWRGRKRYWGSKTVFNMHHVFLFSSQGRFQDSPKQHQVDTMPMEANEAAVPGSKMFWYFFDCSKEKPNILIQDRCIENSRVSQEKDQNVEQTTIFVYIILPYGLVQVCGGVLVI